MITCVFKALALTSVLLLSLTTSIVAQTPTVLSFSVGLKTSTSPIPGGFGSDYKVNVTASNTLANDAPILTFIRGTSYTLIMNGITGSHPFYITDDSIGGGAGTTYFGPITDGNSGVFTPTASTPSLLWYECHVHAQMGNQINIVNATAIASSSSSTASSSSSAVASSSSSVAFSSSAANRSISSSSAVSSSSTASSSSSSTPASSSSASSSAVSSSSSAPSSTAAPSSSTVASSSSPAASSSSRSSSSPAASSSSAGSSSSALVGASSSSSRPGNFVVYVVSQTPKVAGDPFYNQGFDVEYTLNGAHAPAITMVRGTTYVFALVNLDSVHPFEITPSNVGADSGVAALAGAISSGNFTFTPTANTANTIYYQCVNHQYMGNVITVIDASASSSSSSGVGGGNSASSTSALYSVFALIAACLLLATL